MEMKSYFIEKIKKREIQLFLLILIICIALSLYSNKFLNFQNIRSILMGMSYDLVVAIGMTIVLILGALDLSVGSNLALTSVVTTLLMAEANLSAPVAIILGLGISILVGFTNGLFVTVFKINPFIITLGMMSIVRGIARVLTAGYFVTGLPDSFLILGQGGLFNIPYPVIISFLMVIGLDLLLRNWVPLRRAFYVGSNPDNAELFGIKVGRLLIAGFILSGFFSGVSAIFMSSRLAMGYSQFGVGLELRALGASVIGGASFKGGRGSIWGTFLGVLLLAVVRNGFVLMGVSSYWHRVINGLIIVVAIVASYLSTVKE